MAKLTLSDVSNIGGNPTSAQNTINTNNSLIEVALQNTLSRDGSLPNHMLADIDMNNNDIVNVDNLDVNSLSVDGVPVQITSFLRKENNLSDLTDITAAKINLSLQNVDNTSDLNKPISAATQAALDLKSDVGHVHAITDITGLQPALDSKATTASLITHISDTTNPHNVTQTQVGLGNVDNTSDLNKPISTATQTALDLKENKVSKGVANGYASLGPDGRVPSEQLPVSGSYRGVWDASTNTPTITSGVGTNGDFYKVSVAGTTTIDGVSSWGVGDEVRFNGTVWQKIVNTDSVTSVNGLSGAVVIGISEISGLQTQLDSKEPSLPAGGTTSHYLRGDKTWQTLNKTAVGLANVDNTSDLNKPISTATQTALDGKQATLGFTPVNKAGDTMTGNLTVQKGHPLISVARTDDTAANAYGFLGSDGLAEWFWMNPGSTDGTFPNGMVLARRDATGAPADRPITVNYTTGEVQLGTSTQYATALGGFQWTVAIAAAAATDLNTLVKGGVYRVENPTNGPFTMAVGQHVYVEVIAFSSTYAVQRLMTVNVGGTGCLAVWVRKQVASTWGAWAPETGFVTPAHFGAKGYATPIEADIAGVDYATAVTQWLDSKYPKLCDAWYRISTSATTTLTSARNGIYIQGSGASGGIRLDNGAGIYINGADLSNPNGSKFDAVTIKDLFFYVNSSVTEALSIAFVAGDIGSSLPALHMSNVHFVASSNTSGPTNAMILLTNVRQRHLENVSGLGKYGSYTGAFIKDVLGDSSAPTECVHINCRAAHFATGFLVQASDAAPTNDDAQGYHYHSCTALAVDRGWDLNGGAEGFGEWFTLTSCHAYFREIGIYGVNVGNVKVIGCYMLAHGSMSPTQAIALTGTSIVNVVTIIGNTLKMDAATGATKYSINVPSLSGVRGFNSVIGTATLSAPNVTRNGGV